MAVLHLQNIMRVNR